MTKPVVVRSSSVEAAKLLVRRNAERGRPPTGRPVDWRRRNSSPLP